METTKKLLPEGHPNRPGIKLSALKAIVVHYTQNDSPDATAAMNIRYIGRKYVRKEAKTFESDGETPFHFGSAHVFCDMNEVIESIPTDEVSWGCGDKNYNRGYQRIAEKVFHRRQNFETISVEICNNDAIKNSDEDWDLSAANAKQWIIDYLNEYGIKVDKAGSLNPQTLEEAPPPGTILLLRHYDITGKLCPKPFLDNPKDWKYFVEDVVGRLDSDRA